jgi:hypothetical protein
MGARDLDPVPVLVPVLEMSPGQYQSLHHNIYWKISRLSKLFRFLRLQSTEARDPSPVPVPLWVLVPVLELSLDRYHSMC